MVINLLSAGVLLDVAYSRKQKAFCFKDMTTREQESTKWACILTREGLERKVFQ